MNASAVCFSLNSFVGGSNISFTNDNWWLNWVWIRMLVMQPSGHPKNYPIKSLYFVPEHSSSKTTALFTELLFVQPHFEENTCVIPLFLCWSIQTKCTSFPKITTHDLMKIWLMLHVHPAYPPPPPHNSDRKW